MTVFEELSDTCNGTSGKSVDEENLEIFCKQMLKTRIFQGSYQERRYVDHLNGYRDLIVLDKSELELKGDLKYIRYRLSTFYKATDVWFGITMEDMIGAPAGTCVWTEIEDSPFGNYWFLIKTIRFKRNEIYIKLKPLRLVSADAITAQCSRNAEASNSSSEELTRENIVNLLYEWKRAMSSSLMSFLSNDLNRENIVAALRFISLLVLSILTGALEFVKLLGVFSIRLFAEGRLFLRTATPIILKIIELISKVIGGFFIVITMIWRDLIGGLFGKSTVAATGGLASSQMSYQPIADRPFYGNRRNVF